MRQQGITSANRVAVTCRFVLRPYLPIVNRIGYALNRYTQVSSGWGHSVIKHFWVLQNPIHFFLFCIRIQGYNWLCFPPTEHPPLLPFPKQIMLLSTRSPQWPWHSVLVRTSPRTCLSLKSSSVKNNINIRCHFCLDDSTSITRLSLTPVPLYLFGKVEDQIFWRMDYGFACLRAMNQCEN